MRLCRYEDQGTPRVGFYTEHRIIPLAVAATAAGLPPLLRGGQGGSEETDSLLPYLPGGSARRQIIELGQQIESAGSIAGSITTSEAQLLVPVPSPTKLFLLAGNYSAHIEEGGGRAEERARTFPYVFMKPPLTTLTHPGRPVKIPAVSPDHIDWELELGVIIGRRCQGVKESDALDYVAGYTVVNDISDRKFRPNPGRAQREKDSYFDWLHGKWHDTFCPMGPCVLPADELPDPQTLKLTLKVNGHVEQDASTADMVFPVAAVIEFISSFVTLEPGDIISTGTPSGVGAAKGKFLRPGDRLEAAIERIGVLVNPVE
ncbi:MAG: fumarylacetoacetate hydrolase family protein [Planctomycetes bacterium]|nr:fumarylacetoacetate hydrolase family protein [Planctomycetota bacterium]